jgi:2-polyprenyl-3-methyl-5-hydroxy-6-metoxy-1,4-benzoquinol methylase
MQHTQKEGSSLAYKSLCSEYYDIDKPHAPSDALSYYLTQALEVKGPILEPMCGTGRFLISLCKNGFSVTSFDSSPHMIFRCREKYEQEGISCTVKTASFEQFSSHDSYRLVMIPN